MKLAYATLFAGAAADSPEWKIIHKAFSAVTIGISFQDDKTGWTTFTDGQSLPSTVKSTDGGATFNTVKNQTGVHFMPLNMAAMKGDETHVAFVGALESDGWSNDGDTFQQSTGAPVAAQDVKFQGGKLWAAGPDGPCSSIDQGQTYSCIHKVPLVNPGTGRYVSSPAENVIYFTAGSWPSDSSRSRTWTEGAETHRQLTRVLKTVHNSETLESRYEITTEFSANDDDDSYVGELWKSTDNGATWKQLLNNTGDYYFNDIHCFDETHCVTVAEGFAQDGSSDPGARIFLTTDGETFNEVHRENTTGMESLMTCRMISATEHWAGGTTQSGGLFAPALALHSTDGGKTHNNEGSDIKGNMFTMIDVVSAEHMYATTITAAQVCNLLEFGGTNPPAPSPTPTPGAGHYEKPPCQDDEVQASVTGTGGAVCAPPCQGTTCPTDVPEGVTAEATCALSDQSGNQYCALLCESDDQCDSDGGASCATPVPGQPGICVYPTATNGIPMFLENSIMV